VLGSVKQLPKFAKKQLTSLQKQLPNFQLGQAGEQRAIQFLLSHGYQVLNTNVQFGHWEIDVVAIDTAVDEVVFVEVKTRKTDYSGDGSQAVNRQKMLALRKAAVKWLQATRLDKDFRFDLITVLPSKIDHYQNISWEMVK
jgi:putative endonuclease